MTILLVISENSGEGNVTLKQKNIDEAELYMIEAQHRGPPGA